MGRLDRSNVKTTEIRSGIVPKYAKTLPGIESRLTKT